MSHSNSAIMKQWPPIFWLPPELVLMITQELRICDSICLGITCRHMYDKIDRIPWDLVSSFPREDGVHGRRHVARYCDQSRWESLTSLEGMLPNVDLCQFCRIFHPRQTDGSNSPLRPVNTQSPGLECDAKDFSFGRWSVWGLGFQDVYAVMSYHKFGGRCGLPPSHLHFSTDWTFADIYKKLYIAPRAPYKQFLSYFKLDTDAIIDTDQLLVHRTQRLWVPLHEQGTDVLLRYGIGDIANDIRICSHYTIKSDKLIDNFIVPFAKALRLIVAAEDTHISKSRRESVFQRPLLRKCNSCPTQLQTSFHVHHGKQKSIEVVVDVWQNLGPCRAPNDPGWVTCWGRLNPRYRDIVHQWAVEWLPSGAKHLTQSQRDRFRSLAGESAATHPSSAVVLDHWERLFETANSCIGHDSLPDSITSKLSVSPGEPLNSFQFSSLLQEVESRMIT